MTVSFVSTAPSLLMSLKTIQPCCQVPAVAQVSPSAERHIRTTVLRLIASLRASRALEMKLLAYDVSLLLVMALLYEGAAAAAIIARIATVTIASMSVNPRAAARRRERGRRLDGATGSMPYFWMYQYSRLLGW